MLSPADRKTLGKKAADILDAADVVLISHARFNALISRSVMAFDKEHALRTQTALIDQIRDMSAKIQRLQEEVKEAASWRLTGKCRACNAMQPDTKAGS